MSSQHQPIGIGGLKTLILYKTYSTKSDVVYNNNQNQEQKQESCLENKAWFLEEEDSNTQLTIEELNQSTTLISNSNTINPKNNNNNNKIPEELKELDFFLKTSVLFEKESSIFIDAKLNRGDIAWTDWVVIVTIKSGRESASNGAAHLVRSILEKISTSIRVEGINSNNNNNNNNTWVFIDAGKVVVHILSAKSREIYGLEQVWSDSNPNLEL